MHFWFSNYRQHLGRALKLRAWWLALNCLCAALLATGYWRHADPLHPLDFAYLFATTLGYFSLLALLAWSASALPSTLLLPGKRWSLFWALLAGCLLALLIIDVRVYQLYRYHLNPFYVSVLLSGGGGADFYDFSAQTWLLGIACFVFFIVLQWPFQRLATRLAQRRRWPWLGPTLTTSIVLLGLLSQAINIWASANHYVPTLRMNALFPGYPPTTADSWMARQGWSSPAGQATPATWHQNQQGRLNYPRQPLDCPPGERPNVLFVVLESWRAESLRAEVAPRMHDFARKNLRFTRHFSGGNGTQPGMASLLYGINANYWNDIVGNDGAGGPAMIQAMNRQGYRFAAFGSEGGLGRLRFDRYFFQGIPAERMALHKHGGMNAWQSDLASVAEFREFAALTPQTPFFGMVFFDASHHRYHFPPDYTPRFLPSEPAEMSLLDARSERTPYYNQYLNAVGFLDTQVAALLSALGPKLANTIVVITGDHAEEFNDAGQGFWGHGGNFGAWQTQVPLIVHWPGRAAQVINHTTQHIDVSAAILKEALHCRNPVSDFSNGHGLFDPTERKGMVISSYSETGIVTRREILMERNGLVSTTDLALRRKNTIDDPAGLQEALQQMQAFYGRPAGSVAQR